MGKTPPLTDQTTLKLGDGGEDMEDHLPAICVGVDPLTQGAELNFLVIQANEQIGQMLY